MGIKASGSTREIIPAGNYMARCCSMIHIGTIPNNFGNETKLLNKVMITWELPTLLYEHEEEHYSSVISKEYTLSLDSRATLRKDLESWRGKSFTETEADGFDVTKLLGIPCMLNVIHKTSGAGNAYATITSISNVPKGLTCPPAMREQFEFNYEEKFSEETVEDLPEWIRTKVKTSQEYMARMGMVPDKNDLEVTHDNIPPPPPPEEIDDDLPF